MDTRSNLRMRKSVIFSTIIAFGVSILLLTSFVSFAAGTTVTVQTNAASYQASPGTQIIVSGTISPAPGVSGEAVSIQLATPSGSSFIQSTSVDASTGAYSDTFVTGPASSGWTNGTYTVTATYAASISSPTYTGTTSFQYGTVGTTTTSTTTTSTATNTTVTTTITSTTTSTTTSVSTTTLPTTITTISTTTSTVTTPTTITTTTTMTQTSMTWEYIGIAGIAAAIALAGVAAFSMRRR